MHWPHRAEKSQSRALGAETEGSERRRLPISRDCGNNLECGRQCRDGKLFPREQQHRDARSSISKTVSQLHLRPSITEIYVCARVRSTTT